MAGLRKNGAFTSVLLVFLFAIVPATQGLYVNIPAPAPGTGPDMSPGQLVDVTFDWDDGDASVVDLQVFHVNNQYAATMVNGIPRGTQKITRKFPSVSQDAGEIFHLEAVQPGIPGTYSRSGNFVIIFKDTVPPPAPSTTSSKSTAVAPPKTTNTPTQPALTTGISSSPDSTTAPTQTSSDSQSSSTNSGTTSSTGDTQGTRTYISSSPNSTAGGAAPDSSSGSENATFNAGKKKRTPLGPIIGGVVGGVVLLVIIGLLWLRLRKKENAGSPSLEPFVPRVGGEMREQPPDNNHTPDYGRTEMTKLPVQSHSSRPSIGNDSVPNEPPEPEEIIIQRQIQELSLRMIQLRGTEQDTRAPYDPPPDYRSQRMSVV